MSRGPFSLAIRKAMDAIRDRSLVVHPGRWQSVDVSHKPEAATHEVLNYSLASPVYGGDLALLAEDIEPNLPWADDHFLERVGGEPLNPGKQWALWPWGHSADKFRTTEVPSHVGNVPDDGKGFSHSYMERMWPKHAGGSDPVHDGIRYKYGDARDIIAHLAKDPLSRQAFLPIWFPEDTGKSDVRVPCTLGYHFIMRGGFFHCTYYIRSCDAYRHLRDDIYLTVRLQLWMLEQLKLANPEEWEKVSPGLFTMHIVSLHLFRNDYIKLFGAKK